MSLDEWRKNGWLKAHRTSASEIADLLALADRDLKDRKKRSMSIYDSAGLITHADVSGILPFAADLVDRIKQWLRTEHPNLVP